MENLHFYNYDAALSFYEGQIDRMHQGNVGKSGVKIIAKPILILSLIKGVQTGVFPVNRFAYDDLNAIYEPLFKKYFVPGRQQNLTPLSYPFYYLQTDGFWHLSFHSQSQTETNSPSQSWIRNNVDYGYVDSDFWLLLQNRDCADSLAEFVIEKKIVNKLSSLRNAAEPGVGYGGLLSFLAFLIAV